MTAQAPDSPDRYFFVHIMKTAGTALRRRLINHFGESAVYPAKGLDGNDPLKRYLSIDHMREQLEARGDQIRVITGHFPLRTVESLDGSFKTLTLLREPVERIYDDRLGRANNQMTKQLAMTPEELRASIYGLAEVDQGHLERAKEALAEMDAVGLQEHLEDFCIELADRFNWRLGEPVTVNTNAPVEVPESFRARIASDNSLDFELYEFAKGLISAGATQPGLETADAER